MLNAGAQGPTTAAMLADLGADVIKVENPDRPDEARSYGHRNTDDGEPTMDGVFQQYNRGKRGITLNIQTEEGRSILKKLLADADVFVTNVRLQSLQKLGLDYDSLKADYPRLVYAQLSAWGLAGSMAADPGYVKHSDAFLVFAARLANPKGITIAASPWTTRLQQ